MQTRDSGPDGIQYYQVRLGRGGDLAHLGLEEGWVGVGWMATLDLTRKFPDDWRSFNSDYRQKVMDIDGVETAVSAGLACSATWTVARGLKEGDIVITPDQSGTLHFGRISGDYFWVADTELPHRRRVTWLGVTVPRNEVSDPFRRSLSAIQTVANLGEHWKEMQEILSGRKGLLPVYDDVENPMAFALEKHLEDFLVSNWDNTDLAKDLDIYEVDGEQVGQQFPSDTGNIDILAQSKDGKELVVIELKRGRVSDVVVGQLLRYMGFVAELDPSKSVRGIIIGTDDDQKFRRALSMTPNVDFYKYEVAFSIKKSS